MRTGSSSDTEFDRLGLGDELLIDLVDGLEVLVAVADLDAHLPEDMEDPFEMVGLDVDLREGGEDVVGCEVAVVLALDDQRFGGADQQVRAGRRRQGGCAGAGGAGGCAHFNSAGGCADCFALCKVRHDDTLTIIVEAVLVCQFGRSELENHAGTITMVAHDGRDQT